MDRLTVGQRIDVYEVKSDLLLYEREAPRGKQLIEEERTNLGNHWLYCAKCCSALAGKNDVKKVGTFIVKKVKEVKQ